MTTVTLMARRWSGVFVVALIITALLTVACGKLEVPTAPTETAVATPGTAAATPDTAAPVGETRIIELSGDLAFGEVRVGAKASRELTISNSGNSTLTWSLLSTGNEVFTASPASGVVPANGAGAVTLTFTPATFTPATASAVSVSYSSTLTLSSDATSVTNTTMMMSGTGTIYPGEWSPTGSVTLLSNSRETVGESSSVKAISWSSTTSINNVTSNVWWINPKCDSQDIVISETSIPIRKDYNGCQTGHDIGRGTWSRDVSIRTNGAMCTPSPCPNRTGIITIQGGTNSVSITVTQNYRTGY